MTLSLNLEKKALAASKRTVAVSARRSRTRRSQRFGEALTPEALEVRSLLSTTPVQVAALQTTELTPSQTYVNSLFQDLLGRPADALAYQSFATPLDKGQIGASDVVGRILTSQEYRDRITTQLFQNYLGRDPGSQGLKFGEQYLANVGTTRALQATILGSDEFYTNNGSTPEGFVNGVFQKVLNRPANSGSEIFVQALQNGSTRAQVAFAILNSPESNINTTNQLVSTYLGGSVPQVLVASYENALNRGAPTEQVAFELLTSPLYADRIGLDSLRFGPVDQNPDLTYAAIVDQIILNRQPSQALVLREASLLQSGALTREDLVRKLLQLNETQTNGVNGLYNQLLGRNPSGAERDAALRALRQGANTTQLEAALLSSDEYFQQVGNSTNQGYVRAVFLDVLGREPTPGSEIFVNALDQGASRYDVAYVILSSPEAHTKFTEDLYLQLIGRPPSDSQEQMLVNDLNNGATRDDILVKILTSSDFTNSI